MKVGNYPVNTQNVNQQNVSSQNNIQINTSAGTTGLPQSMSSLTQGQVFEATITRDESGKITIHLANGESVTARMEGSVNLLENTATFFEVKSNQGGQLALRAVTQDANANPTLLKALAQAGVAVDTSNIHLVQEMMKQQLPIDAKSLANMVRLAYANKGVEPSTLVQLTKLGVPVTQENISQFNNYISGEGNVVQDMENVIGQLTRGLENYTDSGMSGQEVLSRLQNVFNTETAGEGFGQAVQNGTTETMSAVTGNTPEGNVTQLNSAPASETNAEMINSQHGANTDAGATGGTMPEAVGNMQGGTAEALNGQVLLQGTEAEMQSGVQQNPVATLESFLQTQSADFETLMKALEQWNTKNMTTDSKELFHQLADYIQKLDLSQNEYQSLFQNKGFQELLRGVIEQEWLMKPEQVATEKVSELYEKIQNQLNKLEGLLQQLGQGEQSALQGTRQAQGNVTFMNDLSQFYNYVQIPLKMANENARGDLYVYTDKRALRAGKEELTAHLHLELEHLGMTDVYVRLKEKKLTTNFIMEKEESLDLVMEHMDILTKRLEQKGFSVTMKGELSTQETQPPDFMQEILNKELPSVAIQRYSLDVIV